MQLFKLWIQTSMFNKTQFFTLGCLTNQFKGISDKEVPTKGKLYGLTHLKENILFPKTLCIRGPILTFENPLNCVDDHTYSAHGNFSDNLYGCLKIFFLHEIRTQESWESYCILTYCLDKEYSLLFPVSILNEWFRNVTQTKNSVWYINLAHEVNIQGNLSKLKPNRLYPKIKLPTWYLIIIFMNCNDHQIDLP